MKRMKLQKMNKLRYLSIFGLVSLLTILIFLPVALKAQGWEVPPDRSALVSPFLFDDEIRRDGASLYRKHCLSCHGEPGKNAPAALDPSPGDPASESFRKLTDGDIFYKITVGRGLMPRFENVISENERWYIVAYIRTYHDGYIQPEPIIIADDGKVKVKINLTLADRNQLSAYVYSVDNKDTIPASNIRLVMLLKRYFGNLQLGESLLTNENGIAIFSLSDSLSADTAGNVTLIVRPENRDAFGDVEAVTTVQAGIINNKPPLNEQRAMWNTLRKTPLWLLFTYAIALIAVWSVLGYIIMQLVRMKRNSGQTKQIQ
jgi:hypothetical protein